MKLRHKIAGTLALPLALAIAASTANAATVVDTDAHTLKIGGYVGATAGWTIKDKAPGQDSDVDFDMGLGVSRLNIAYTQKTAAGDITYLYENDWAGLSSKDSGDNTGNNEYRLRHAAISYNGWVAGYTWSGFANLTALAETIDAAGTSGNSANAPRTASLGKNISIADGMTIGVFAEDYHHPLTVGGTKTKRGANTPLPDLVVNFKGDFGVAQAFAAVRMVQVDKIPSGTKAKTEGKVDFTLGVNSQVTDELNLKAAVTSFDEGVKVSDEGRDLAFSVAGQYKINDQIRTNLVVEQFIADEKDSDYTAIWVNAFYKMDAGWEWGAELRSVSADDNSSGVSGLGDKDMSFTLQAKYAF